MTDHQNHHDSAAPGHGPHSDRTGSHGGGHDHGSHDGGDHDKHEGHSVAMFRDRFWWSLALTVPTLVWGDLLQRWLGYTAPTFPGSEYVSPVFGTAVFVYGGRVFVHGAILMSMSTVIVAANAQLLRRAEL